MHPPSSMTFMNVRLRTISMFLQRLIDILVRDALDISMKWPEEHFQYRKFIHICNFKNLFSQKILDAAVESVGPMVTASRHFTGYGQERGGLRITIHNRNKDQAVSVIYYDAIPWFLKLYLHTLQVEVHGSDIDGDGSCVSARKRGDLH